jgi:uncharacterized protein YaaR (DUF327 family)
MSEDQRLDQDVDLHDDENEFVEEAATHDPKNAEMQSVAATDKAGKATKKAPARKGDKSNSEPMQKVTAKEQSYDFSADLDALVENEATLSEEFKQKTAIIFEAAIKSKISEEIDRLETEYATSLEEEVAATKADLVEKVDSYLNYVVEQWMEDNKLAIQTGLRTEIAEGFMSKLKDLFTESYIDVPESKVDLVDELAAQVEELEEQLNKTTGDAIRLAEDLEMYKRDAIVREAARDLAETQVGKLKSLVEDIDFENEETFARKVSVVKESYFTKKATSSTVIIDEEAEEDAEEQTAPSDVMQQYVNAIRKSVK